jgi:hypothetical protein
LATRRGSDVPAATRPGAEASRERAVYPLPALPVGQSVIARYLFLDCERQLRYWVTPKAERAAGIPDRQFDHSPLMRAVLAGGYAWERQVVEHLLVGRVDIAPGTGPLTDRQFSVPDTLDLLCYGPPGHFLYQLTLRPPRRFYESLGIDPDLVALADNHPNLVEVRADGAGGLLRVLDVKRGEELQLNPRVQIAPA